MKQLKVWGGIGLNKKRKFVRTIVATSTKKKAVELLDISMNEFNTYWTETSNPKELTLALKKPETVIYMEK